MSKAKYIFFYIPNLSEYDIPDRFAVDTKKCFVDNDERDVCLHDWHKSLNKIMFDELKFAPNMECIWTAGKKTVAEALAILRADPRFEEVPMPKDAEY